jgi:5'-nucleotidase
MALVALLAAWTAAQAIQAPARPDLLTLSIVGTTDLHGRIFADEQGRGGLALLGGFVNNLRAAREADGGAVMLLDAGDTFQGGIESNLSEGGIAVDAYNAMGYAALAIGNHDFEYGARDLASGLQAPSDLRGALKAAAARARFPFLAANLVDESGRAVDWPNVRPSAVVDLAGIPVGVVGVMTFDALSMTLAANIGGLRTTPLVPAIAAEATRLRASGARAVVVVSHAGGGCHVFGDPGDLSTCDVASEIFDVARRLPKGLVDAIVAGHTHERLGHVVEGIPIVQGGALGQAFARVDLVFDRRTTRVVSARPLPPRQLCAWEDPATGACREAGGGVRPTYEGQEVIADTAVQRAMAPELARVRALQAQPLGVVLDAPFVRTANPESSIANLFADALRAQTPGAEIALSFGSGPGGLRADLPQGRITFGALYDVFPFDNRVVRLTLTGAELQQVLEAQLFGQRRGRVTGLSGLRAEAVCSDGGWRMSLRRDSGEPIRPSDRLAVATPEYSAGRALWGAVPGGSAAIAEDAAHASGDKPLVREVVADWLRRRGGHLHPDEFFTPARARLQLPSSPDCRS